MTAKRLAVTQNINANKQNQLKIKKVSEYDQEIPQSQTADNPVAPRGNPINFAVVVCVYWYTDLSLACYSENIRIIYVVDENILPNSVCLARK